MATSCQVSVVDDQLRVEWFGPLSESVIEAGRQRVSQELASGSARTVVVITSAVTDCPESARKQLVALQRELGARGRRSAWVDERARFRGLALWVMHLAEDQNSKAVGTLDLAQKWVNSNEAREQHVARKAVGT